MKTGVYHFKGSDFTMNRYLKVLFVGENNAFVKVLYPKAWGLTPKETTISLKKLKEQYTIIDSYNKDFYIE